jgi:adenylosuccinate lyase
VIPRYTPLEIAQIFSDESRLQRWLDIELLAAEGWAELDMVPKDALPKLRLARIDKDRIDQLEVEQGHDIAAFVAALQETVGEEGRYLHLGLTSSDIVDTALATQLRDAAAIIDKDAQALEQALATQAERHRLTMMMGRTHGVHAEPLTFGIKLANHYDEVRRSRERLRTATAEIAVGQLSGAVGTHATVSPLVEEHVCRSLGLTVAPATTQVIARDRHAAFVSALAILTAVLERLATTIRLLQITEVDEVEEPFSERQKGSSAMPHKHNPILCERICGIARVLRGHAMTALDNVALWHERDISHSSAERMILPDACALTAYALRLATRVVTGLKVKPDNMRTHIDAFGGVVFSQRVLSALIMQAQWPRERAYRAVQELARRARDGEAGFRDLVVTDKEISEALTEEHVERIFDVHRYLNHINDTYERLGLSTTDTAADTQPAAQQELAVEAGLGGGRL